MLYAYSLPKLDIGSNIINFKKKAKLFAISFIFYSITLLYFLNYKHVIPIQPQLALRNEKV